MAVLTLTDDNPELLDLLVHAANVGAALGEAHEHGVFQHLADHPDATVATVAEAIGIPLRSAEMLLGALRAVDLVRSDELGGLSLNPAAAHRLTGDLAADLRFQRQIVTPGLEYLGAALRSGVNEGVNAFPGSGDTVYDRVADTPLEHVLHDHLRATAARALPAMINTGALRPVRHLLDIGGGPGTNALAVADAHPSVVITIVDIPSVIELASDIIAHRRLSDRIRTHAADVITDPLPTDADAVLLAHMAPILDDDVMPALLRKLHRSLPPGGRILLLDPMLNDDDKAGPIGPALHQLYLSVIASAGAELRTWKHYEQWLEDAGFTEVRQYVLPVDHGLHVATKPSPPHG